MPKRLRYYLERDPAVLNAALHIFLTAIERMLRQHSPGASATSRLGAVIFIHRFGALLNTHLHFHCIVIDGVFEADAQDGVTFHPASGVDAPAIAAVQATVRKRLLRAVERRGLLSPKGTSFGASADDAQVMAEWEHGGGFSVDAQVRIEAHERDGLERLLRYCARPAFALERLREIDSDTIARSSGGADSATAQTSSPLLRGAGAQLTAARGGHRAGAAGRGYSCSGDDWCESIGRDPDRAGTSLGSSLRLGTPARSHLRGATPAVSQVRWRDEGHRLHHRGGGDPGDSRTPGRADVTAASDAGAGAAAVGDAGQWIGRYRSASATRTGLRVRSAHRVIGHKTNRLARRGRLPPVATCTANFRRRGGHWHR